MEALTGITVYKPTAGMAAEKSARLDRTSTGKTTGLMKTHVDANLRDSRPRLAAEEQCPLWLPGCGWMAAGERVGRGRAVWDPVGTLGGCLPRAWCRHLETGAPASTLRQE